MPPFGLYVHIPFCQQRCPYCAFVVLTGQTALYERYVEAVCTEIRSYRHLEAKGPLQTIFFGGGTPSLFQAAQLGRILDTAEAVFGVEPAAEITLEANPSSAESVRFDALKRTGFNRLSLGVQACNDADLRTLGRMHNAAEAESAYVTARRAGFRNVNVEVIFSIPGMARSRWQHTLERVIAWQPEHVSTYSLTLEEGTKLAQHAQQGHVPSVSEEDDAWAFTYAIEVLDRAGYEHYEVSSFARPGFRARHNWGYWHGAEYLGVGLAAHSFFDGRRRWNGPDLPTYLARLGAGQRPCGGEEVLDDEIIARERIWLQLHTCEGVELTPGEVEILQGAVKFQSLRGEDLVQLVTHRLRLTRLGYLLADAIVVAVVEMIQDVRRRDEGGA
ncbi:MAG: radical SAM family heme chaperone HemW [Candidatus Tectomicrobia bacterium]